MIINGELYFIRYHLLFEVPNYFLEPMILFSETLTISLVQIADTVITKNLVELDGHRLT